ncbi:uncharacterized mitochondrial protein-like protein, partial [Tanacetum coccineum]
EKALYGLHQAPKAWTEVISYDAQEIPMSSIGELTLFLGLQVQQKEDRIFISQDKYVDDILKKFDFTTIKTASTPIETNKALNKDEEAEDVDVHLYRLMIGSLMYLIAFRPDIMFAVCACARDSPFDLEAFFDSDYARASLDSKPTIGDKTVNKEWEDRMERAATTASSLEAEQDSVNDVRLNLLLPILVYATRHTLTAVRHKLMLPSITCHYWFWASAKAKIINRERQIQALLDNKKVIITETSIRSDLKLNDDEGIDCLPTATIFAELERMGTKTTTWNEFSSTMASAIIFFMDKQVEGMTRHKGVYVTPSHTKKVFANMKRPCTGFSGRVTPLLSTMMVQATKDMGANSATHTDSHSTPIITQPSSSKLQKKTSRRKQRKESAPTKPTTENTTHEEHVSTPSYDPPQSDED